MTVPTIWKNIPLLAILYILGPCTYGQKTEINFNAYTTIFGFRGNGTATTSYVNAYHLKPETSTYNVYGKKGAFSYSLELQAQQITKQNIIYGLGTGFEVNKSKVNIDTVRINDVNKPRYAALGETILKNSYLTLNPFIGHRYVSGKIIFEMLIGFDFAFCLKSQEIIKASIDRDNYETFQNNKIKPSIDYRPRIQIKTQYKKAGLLLGYSLGLTNYTQESNTNAYTNLIRLGLSYRLK